MKTKTYLAGIMAIGIVMGMAGCGSGDSSSTGSSKSKAEDFSATDNIKVADAESIEKIPDDAEKTILYLVENDINPTKGNPEKSADLQLFESKGGKIKFIQTTHDERFDKLSLAIQSNKDVPDIFKYEWLAFPYQVVKGMYQPVDDIVDFSQPLWAGAKKSADQFVLDGKHYVAPLGYTASSMLCYDKDIMDSEGFDDPYETYKAGKWTWDAWNDMMMEYVSNASNGEERYGVNGFFRGHIIQQTGKQLVNYDQENNKFVSNLDDPDIAAGEEFLSGLLKNNLILDGWLNGFAKECFSSHCLFYAMGDWAYSGSNGPDKNDHWGIVPMPAYTSNPQKITTSDMTAYMWVNGSKKKEAVKCWFECSRATHTDEKYVQTNKDKFMENNKYWTDDMYDAKMDVISDEYLMFFDNSYGISSMLGDAKHFDGNQCLTDALYGASSTPNEDGKQVTWNQFREKYAPTVQSEIDELNKKIK